MEVNVLLDNAASWLGIMAALGMTLAGYLAKQYLVPFLKIGQRHKFAQYIAIIADEVTDELRARYPDKKWLAHLDEAVDRLAAICGISLEIAGRAVKASAARK